MFINKLIESIKEKKSSVVVGLDPRLELIPSIVKDKYFKKHGKTFKAAAESILEFNKEIIDNVCDIAVAVKPQIAFYEQYGIEGLKAYDETCRHASKKGLLIIGDIKRGDIGSTSKAYSKAHLGKTEVGGEYLQAFYSDSITVNPYLGDDCLKEFVEDIEEYEKGMFVLVKTSNPSSSQLQDLEVEGKKIYEKVAEMVNNWSDQYIGKFNYSSIGAVVGATYPEEAKRLRELMPSSYFLVPGYGAQGGTADDVVPCFNKDGLGAVVNSSRGILYAYKKEEKWTEESYGKAARDAAITMRDDINTTLEKHDKKYW
ncbi:orotidine-5'-phosphate decarboxylase [Paramaledivibacter caminithermalis]|jgi:orotidine-5'-phosphate decarboxylase|uniref:Orotidine 5'-phosphate decarboxylase n=1 Tax=Paramaledivibacter caminithermalis (strain DSM 15212 / CIP 107654 / DViRD3) TaxID=1121301 RepID=A0A1M6TNH0_PARC5|nr:orotidine-5'-phosphate decarboxylase [Paramaledivibacter caminithermalis]SHK58484.1 orotidine-5'-phosphate decarboxylase [Paramaledivibacter caminithermalis DSM 15212]